MNPDSVVLAEIIDLKSQVLMLRAEMAKKDQHIKELEAEVARLTPKEPD